MPFKPTWAPSNSKLGRRIANKQKKALEQHLRRSRAFGCPPYRREGDEAVCGACGLRWGVSEDRPPCRRP